MGTEIARTKKVERNVQTGGRTEVRLQFKHVLRKSVAAAAEITAECASRELVAARRPAKAEIDATRIERLKRAELFGDDERRVVRKHDPAGADTDASRLSGDVSDDDRSGRAGDARKVVMFGEPVAMIAPLFRVLREIDRVAESERRIGALNYRRKVENGERNHNAM